MTYNENSVKPVDAVSPVVMNRTRRLEAVGVEERYSENMPKKRKRNPSNRASKNKCIITQDKVDCKI